MTKKLTTAELEANGTIPTFEEAMQDIRDTISAQEFGRETALNLAIQHHKINGGMLHPAQLIENAKQFNAYIKGETK